MSKMKYVWAAALVALCLSLSGAALAADGWTVAAQDLPGTIEWDATYDASVDADNTGTTDWTDPEFELVSVDGPTATAVEVNRWGLETVPVSGVTVAPAGSYLFEFTVTGPPITTMLYSTPWTSTGVAAVDTLDCNWILANSGALITTDIAPTGTVVGRFPDDQPGTAGAWARFWIQELAGRVPLVVAGYPDGTYRPEVEVDRAAMAVYMTRALDLATAAYQGTFTDVDSAHWAWPWIEALADAGIVAGYGDGTYRPSVIVNRDAMAVYVARGIVGGLVVPSGPSVGTFTDVADYDPGPAHWAYDEVEYAVAQNVVQGFGDGTYRPDYPVTRAQMAVFVYKGFIMPTGVAVVLGGPAITDEDVATDAGAGLYGWTSSASGAQADPGYAYVIFDAARIDYNLADGGTWDVTFELIGPASPTPTATVSMNTTAIQNAFDACDATGVPYLVVDWDIPGALTTGDYVLVVKSNGVAIARQPDFTITP